jgi:alpha-tubulin suppressor-like RCC1 family protein
VRPKNAARLNLASPFVTGSQVWLVTVLVISACGARTELGASMVTNDGSIAHDASSRPDPFDARAPTADVSTDPQNEPEASDALDSSVAEVGADVHPRPDADGGIILGATLALGGDHTCAIRPDSTVLCWGLNGHSELGDGTQANSAVPRYVPGIMGAVEVAAGNDYSCARLSDGTVRCWGNNDSGQLGDGTKGGNRTSPVQVIGLTGARELALGASHSCARLIGGVVKCWGSNESGQLGTGNTDSTEVPVLVPGLSDVVQLAVGKEPSFGFTCARLVDRSVKCWGDNIDGAIGPACPTGICSSPVTVEGLPSASAIGASESHVCAIPENGTPVCWGTWSHTSFPIPGFIPVEGISGAVELAVGILVSCARISTGAVLCWGDNSQGEFGDGTKGTSYLPGLLSGKPGVVSGPSEAVEVAAGNRHACARGADGYLSCWGWNVYGQLGNGAMGIALTPVHALGWP